jgi:hypothetical protein
MFPDVIRDLTAAYGLEHWVVANARSLYGVCLTRLERFEEAEVELLQAHALLADSGTTARRRRSAERLANLYAAWGKPEQTARWRTAADDESDTDEEEQ